MYSPSALVAYRKSSRYCQGYRPSPRVTRTVTKCLDLVTFGFDFFSPSLFMPAYDPLGVASEQLPSREVGVTRHRVWVQVRTPHTHPYRHGRFLAHHCCRDCKDEHERVETMAGRREHRKLWRHSNSTVTSAASLPLNETTARKLAIAKSFEIVSPGKSLANAFFNKMEDRSVAGQLHLKLLHSSIKQTTLTLVEAWECSWLPDTWLRRELRWGEIAGKVMAHRFLWCFL